ncbi:MAG: hypothetical protein JWO38_5241 [Gemmataceae bacterium]|nr:hypothetical protein [Gemmataceae bacterium]
MIVSGEGPARHYALKRISNYPAPVPERQAEVAAALMGHIEKNGDGYDEMRALAIWATPTELEKVPKYLSRGALTKAAIYVLCKKKVAGAAKKVAAFLADGGGDGKALVQALIEIGPPCEEYVLPFLTEENRGATHRALQVLAEVGGEKSLEPVRALTTSKKADLIMPAKITLARIEERLNEGKAK